MFIVLSNVLVQKVHRYYEQFDQSPNYFKYRFSTLFKNWIAFFCISSVYELSRKLRLIFRNADAYIRCIFPDSSYTDEMQKKLFKSYNHNTKWS